MTKEQDIKALAEIIAKHDFDNENFEAEWFNATSAEKNQYRINAKDLAATIYNAGYRLPVKHTVISDAVLMKDYCANCDYRAEGCWEKGKQSTCKSYKYNLAKRKAQVDKDNTR